MNDLESILAVERILPFPVPTSIPHGESVTLTISSAVVFRPVRLEIDPTAAAFFMVTEIRVGSLLLLDAPISAAFFPPLPSQLIDEAEREEARRLLDKIRFPTMPPNMEASLTIQHRENCPWHADCAMSDLLSKECVARACEKAPFSAILSGIALQQ